MRYTGLILFVIGIVVAVLAAAKLSEGEPNTFPNTWPLSILGIVIAVAGLALWRRTGSILHPSASGNAQSINNDYVGHLKQVIKNTGQLLDQWEKQDAEQRESAVSRIMEQEIMMLSAAQKSMVSSQGMSRAAEVLVASATGERLLQRAWSALADGYPGEAYTSIENARNAFQNSLDLASATPR